jgi:D-glycero-alpha-D-manno-heptose-7-phosphate kinase
MTLSASMYVTFTERSFYEGPLQNTFGNAIRIAYTKTEHVDDIRCIEHELIRETLLFIRDSFPSDWIPPGFEITTIGDIPSRGAGLGSSAAVVVGVLKAIFGDFFPMSIGEIADIERVRLNHTIGWQDQMAAVYGGLREWAISGKSQISDIPMPEVGDDLAGHLIAFRLPANRTANAANAGGHDNLVGMADQMKQYAPYLRKTVELVDDMKSALLAKDWEEAGKILQVAWQLKNSSHGYVDKNISRWYSLGKARGALAGKVSGSMSKGAGHLFFLTYPDDRERIRKALGKELAEMKVEYYPHGSKVWEI